MNAARQGPQHGEIRGNVWRKTLRASVHQLRCPPGWAVDRQDLSAAERAGAELIVIEDVESGKTYLASLSVIREKGIEFERGCGAQAALELKRWYCFGPDTAPALQLRLGLEAL